MFNQNALCPLLLAVFFWFCCPLSDCFADDPAPEGMMKVRKDGKIVLMPLPPDPSDDEREGGVYIDEEGLKRSMEAAKKTAEQMGWEPPVLLPGGSNKPLKEISDFEMPFDQLIDGCGYTPGYTFPNNCTDEEGNFTFRAGIDPQSKLDALKLKQGIKGEYNVVPENYDPEGCQIDKDGNVRPCLGDE